MDKTPLQENKSTEKHSNSFKLPIQKNSLILALFAIACTAIVGLVNEITKDKIKVQAQRQLLNTLHNIIEPSRYDNDITQDCVSFNFKNNDLDSVVMNKAYIARKSGEVKAVAITNTAPDGYNGNIELIVAINNDGSVNGVRVLNHKETPGLGDKVEIRKSDWITSFNGKEISSDTDSRWAVAKDGGVFDQFTGATITPRAVVKSVKETVLYFKENKQALLTLPNACAITENKEAANSEVDNDQ